MCAPVFKRVAETVMAQRFSSDYSQARDSANCHIPVVSAGNVVAAQSVLERLGIKYTSPLDTEESPLTWGTAITSGSGVSLSPVDNKADKVVPDVRGYGLRDALFRLEKMGLKVKVRGIGRVTQQNMQPGYQFKPDEEIELILGDPKDIPAAELDTLANDSTRQQVGNASSSAALQQQSKSVSEPEDYEAAPTKADEKKLKQQEAEQQQRTKERKADKAKQNAEEQERKAAQQKKAKQPAIEPPKQKTTAQKAKSNNDKKKVNKKQTDKKSVNKKTSNDKSTANKAKKKN